MPKLVVDEFSTGSKFRNRKVRVGAQNFGGGLARGADFAEKGEMRRQNSDRIGKARILCERLARPRCALFMLPFAKTGDRHSLESEPRSRVAWAQALGAQHNAALADPNMKARIADAGGTVAPGSPAEFGKLIADETEKWAKVVEFAGIKPE